MSTDTKAMRSSARQTVRTAHLKVGGLIDCVWQHGQAVAVQPQFLQIGQPEELLRKACRGDLVIVQGQGLEVGKL